MTIDDQQREDERIITRAFGLVLGGEKLRWPAQKELAAAAARVLRRQSAAAPVAQDEQHKGDDGKDDEDRPQHGDDSTPPVCAPLTNTYDLTAANRRFSTPHDFVQEVGSLDCFVCGQRSFAPIHTAQEIKLDGTAYKIVTPEIQAVLDRAAEWVRGYAIDRPGSPEMPDYVANLWHAASKWLASTEPPKPPEPFTKVIIRDSNTGQWAINASVPSALVQESWECEVRPIRRVQES